MISTLFVLFSSLLLLGSLKVVWGFSWGWSWGTLGSSWAPQGSSWRLVGWSWGPPGSSWGALVSSWASLGVTLSASGLHQGCSLAAQRCSWAPWGCRWAPQGPPRPHEGAGPVGAISAGPIGGPPNQQGPWSPNSLQNFWPNFEPRGGQGAPKMGPGTPGVDPKAEMFFRFSHFSSILVKIRFFNKSL